MPGEKSATKALNILLDAWNKLPGGRNYSAKEIEEWLSNDLKPAVDNARKALGKDLDKIGRGPKRSAKAS